VESAGLAIAVALLTLVFRDGVPAALTLLRGRHEIGRETAADERAARKEQAADERKADGVTIRELKELIQVLRSDGQEYRQQIHDLRDEMSVHANEAAICKAQRARAEERIAALEEALDRAGISHRKYDPDPSGTHQVIPPPVRAPKKSPPKSPPEEEARGE
jgi:hypothetical protein